ncbi:MAG TPA: phosphoglucomutase/phosphomannomutase family protein [Chloroflexota bacterium]|nr:phosphoglucomutase/phosphomannomutase family protein [Chloroflexota bacterium]
MTTSSAPISPIKFGTDGWRAPIADTYTFANVRVVAQATANYLHQNNQADHGLIVGYDMRFASEFFAAAAAEVLAANGIDVWLTQVAAPTPAVSYSILTHSAAGAAMITASHNPWTDNGYKYKPEYAGSADPATIEAIERQSTEVYGNGQVERLDLSHALSTQKVRYFDPAPDYIQRLSALADVDKIRSSHLKVVVDPMYGSGMSYFPRILSGGSLQLTEINDFRNPYFGGITPEPIAKNLGTLMAAVPEKQAAAGIAVDGDADRVGLVDEKGTFINQLQVYGLLIMYLLEKKGWRGAIVKSVSTTSMADRLGEKYGVPVIETPVGFKYIGPKIRESNAMIGGEESGGYYIRGHIPERDGVLAGLFLLEMLLAYDMPLSQIVAHLQQVAGPSYYDRIDVRFPEEQRQEVLNRFAGEHPAAIAGHRVDHVQTIDGYKYFLDDGSWLLVRASGTEPLIRLYTEARSPEEAQLILAAGREMAGLGSG